MKPSFDIIKREHNQTVEGEVEVVACWPKIKNKRRKKKKKDKEMRKKKKRKENKNNNNNNNKTLKVRHRWLHCVRLMVLMI